ncbi:MAG: aldehyde dehydrogenase family protein [Christensenellales bacterium]
MIFPMYIDGKWFDGAGRQMQDVVSPGNGEVLGQIPLGTAEDVDAAMQAAKKAAPALAAMSVFERAEICYKIADKIDQCQEELARLLTAEHGKPFHGEAMGEVAACALAFRDAAEQIKWMDGKVVPLRDKNARCLVTRKPKGIFAIITPWNFPLGTACQYYLAAGIAVGDPMVWNPATTTAAVASALMKCFEGVGLPDGAVNMVIGKGQVVGDALSAHPLTAGIGFTGSTVTGDIICGRARCKHTSMELGGDGPCIVLKDADLDVAAQGLMNGSFLNAGQVCTSTERVLVDDAIADALVEKILEKMQTQYQLGDPFDEKTTMGPMHLMSQIEIVESHIHQAVEMGAKVVTGGRRKAGMPTEHYFEPTVVDHVPANCMLHTDETFGPVIPLIRFKSEDEIQTLVEMSDYRLFSAIFTKDVNKALRMAEQYNFGATNINGATNYWDPTIPAGGGGGSQSGHGRSGGKYSIEDMSEERAIVIHLN